MRMKSEDYKAKSIHIFALPFKFKSAQEKASFQYQTMVERLIVLGWQNASLSLSDVDDYAVDQYMSGQAKQIFWEKSKGDQYLPCSVLQYGESEKQPLFFHMEKDDFKASLLISGLEIHIYQDGYGILFIKTLNFLDDIDRIRPINHYGRRFLLPFIPATPAGYSLAADKIGIEDLRGKLKGTITNYKLDIEKYLRSDNEERILIGKNFSSIPYFLFYLLNHGTVQEQWVINQTDIEDISDERMFLFCLVRNDAMSGKVKYNCDSSFRNELYKLIFADTDDATCQDDDMRDRLLKEAIYPRWRKWGTIQAVTNTGMFCITSTYAGINDSVIKPFVTEYLYMYSLVLAQHMGIMLFSERAGDIGKHIIGKIKTREHRELVSLQKEYVVFKNQMLILDFTYQEQGSELYELIQKQMRIDEEEAILDEQLESLYEITNVSNDISLQTIAAVLAIFAIAVDVILNVFISGKEFTWCEIAQISLVTLIVTAVAIVTAIKHLGEK